LASSLDKTVDPLYQVVFEHREKKNGVTRLGVANGYGWDIDPRHLVFTLSRYKFVAKMLSGSQRVVEIGCADAFCSRIVKQEVENLTVTDKEPLLIIDARECVCNEWPIEIDVHDILQAPLPKIFDAAYSLDVLEHIPVEDEDRFIGNVKSSLSPTGVFICGMPSLESQDYASEGSRKGHVNCKTGQDLKRLMEGHYNNVFLFSMNDEVVHTGFEKMAHYLICLCVGPKE